MKKLTVGLVLDNIHTDTYIASFFDWARNQENLEILTLVNPPLGQSFQEVESLRKRPTVRLAEMFLKTVILIEKYILRFFDLHKAHLGQIDLSTLHDENSASLWLLALDASKSSRTITLEQLIDRRVDLLVSFCSAVLSDQLLTASRLGVIAIDYHGNKAQRSSPAGFWEAYHRFDKTEFSIVKLAVKGGGDSILLQGYFPTKFFFLLNQSHLYQKSIAQLKNTVASIANSDKLPQEKERLPYSGRNFTKPNSIHLLLYLSKIIFRVGSKLFFRTLQLKERWSIYVIKSDWRSAALWRGQRNTAPRGRFWADPFLCSHGGKTYCFVEDYVYENRRAHISALEITEKGAELLGTALEESFHLSFPFVFRYKGTVYMCPETSASRQIRIYKPVSFPLKWELASIAVDNISAADSMFAEHGGKWWLFTNIDRSGLSDHCSELCLYYANSPLDQRWTPHPRNPLRLDANGGRNAGLILENGKIFRAAQRQGFDRYGKGVVIFEILTLNEFDYDEREVTAIDSKYDSGALGTHHISSSGKFTVVDNLRRCFMP